MNGRGRKTLELPASGSRIAHSVTTREAHLMPSVVENYERRGERPSDDSGRSTSPKRGSSEMAIEPAKLQMLIRDLIVDGAFARQMEVSPSRTLKKVQYLTERDRKRLSGVDSELLSSLADAASRFAESIGAKQRVLPVGMSDALDRGLKGIGQLGKDGGIGGRRGGMPDLGFLPGKGTGVFLGGRELTMPNDDGSDDAGTGRRSRGGLSRGQTAGLGLPGGAFADDLGALASGWRGAPGGGAPAIDLGFLADFEQPFGGDPLAIARAWHRLNPGEAASDPTRDAIGEKIAGPPGDAPKFPGSSTVSLREAGESLGTYFYPVYPGGSVTPAGGFWAGLAAELVVHAVQSAADALKHSPSSAPRGPRDHRPAEDGTGPTGPRSHGVRFRPADDGSGPVGPRSSIARPADDGTGPVGPRSHSTGSSTTSFGNRFKPNPDDPDGVGPRSRLRSLGTLAEGIIVQLHRRD